MTSIGDLPLEHVPYPTHRVKKLMFSCLTELASQVPDVHVNYVAHRIEMQVPHLFEQLCSFDHTLGVEQEELSFTELQGLARSVVRALEASLERYGQGLVEDLHLLHVLQAGASEGMAGLRVADPVELAPAVALEVALVTLADAMLTARSPPLAVLRS